MNRREAMQTGATVVAVAALPIPALTDNQDAELLALEHRIVREIDDINALPDLSDEEADRRCDDYRELEDRLAEIPAKSITGVSAKLRRVQYYQDQGSTTPWEKGLIATSLEALERLGGVS